MTKIRPFVFSLRDSVQLCDTRASKIVPLALFADKQTAINAVLYAKRYSLLFEGPQRLGRRGVTTNSACTA